MTKLALRLAPLFVTTTLACSATPTPEPLVPGPTAPTSGVSEGPPAPTDDPFALRQPIREEWLPILKGPEPTFATVALGELPKGVPAAPAATCDAYVKRAAKTKPSCADRTAALTLLDQAIHRVDQDQALVELESCAGLPEGLVRSLRSELAPEVCSDVMVEPVLTKKDAKLPGAIQHALIGQALAARLARAVGSPPSLQAPYTKERVSKFVKGPLFKWFNDQAVAVQTLAQSGSELSYYGKGVAALAAGAADLRMVEVMREVPIPDEFKKDPELANAYYSSLDEQLEPRKDRGRNGALVGLQEMAHAGVNADARTLRARSLLAKLYAGRRIDSLDALSRPAAPAPATETVTQGLAASLPTFYANLLLDPATMADARTIDTLAPRGLPVALRVRLKETDEKLTDDVRLAYGRARLDLGIQYWRADDFDAAAYQFSKVDPSKLAPEDRLAFAIAIALRGGPEDATALMLKNEALSPNFADVRALDVVTKENKASPVGAMASFDSAVVKQLAAPRFSDGPTTSKYWDDVASRYEAASTMATDPHLKLKADDLSKAAAATAKFAEKGN